MSLHEQIKLFEEAHVRSVYDDVLEQWFFSIVDICAILTDSIDPQAYWRKLKQRLLEEGNKTVTSCHTLKLVAKDGKKRLTDVATSEQMGIRFWRLLVSRYPTLVH